MQLSQEYFDQALKDLNFGFEKRFDAIDEQFKAVRERFDRVDIELSAVKSMVVIRQELNNLVLQLKGQGIKLDENKIFVVPMRA